MTIRNPDGTPYELSSNFQQYNPENQEFELFNDWDQEIIQIGGSPIYYYEVFIQSNTVDPLFLEDRGKLWSPTPICLYTFYDPIPSQNYLGSFGIDAPDELMFEFNYTDVLKKLGHPPKIGSRLFTPHKRENWEIIQRSDEVYQMWGQLRLRVMCRRWQESKTTADGNAAANEPPKDVSYNAFRAGR